MNEPTNPQKWPRDPVAARSWYEFYAANERLVDIILDCECSCCDIGIDLRNKATRTFFAPLVDKLSMDAYVRAVAREGMVNGRAMPFLRIECPNCPGSLMRDASHSCDHRDGTILSAELLDPLFLEKDEKTGRFSLVANEFLKKIVRTRTPRQIHDAIAPHVRKLVSEGKPIAIDPAAMDEIVAPSMVRNLKDGCTSAAATEIAAMWRRKSCEWLQKRFFDQVARMRGLKAPIVTLVEPRTKVLGKYLPIEDDNVSWQEIRKKLREF